MPPIVVDSSVAIKWFVVEPYPAEAHRILDQYQEGTLTLLAPDLIHAEMGNIVWKKQRFQGLAMEDAQQIIDEFRKLKMDLTSTADLLDDAYRLAVAHARTVYDAMYIALSQHENCPYVTADEKLVNAVRKAFPQIVFAADWLSSEESRLPSN